MRTQSYITLPGSDQTKPALEGCFANDELVFRDFRVYDPRVNALNYENLHDLPDCLPCSKLLRLSYPSISKLFESPAASTRLTSISLPVLPGRSRVLEV